MEPIIATAAGITSKIIIDPIISAARQSLFQYATESVSNVFLRQKLIEILNDDKKKILITLLDVDGEQARFNLDRAKSLIEIKDNNINEKISLNISKYLENAEQAAIRAFTCSKAKDISIQLQAVEFLVECSCLLAIHENLGKQELERRINTYPTLCYEVLTRFYGEKAMKKAIEWDKRTTEAEIKFEENKRIKGYCEERLRFNKMMMEKCEKKVSLWKLHIDSDLSNFGKGFMCIFVVTIPFIVSTVTDKDVETIARDWRCAKYGIEYNEKSIAKRNKEMDELKDDIRRKPEEFTGFGWFSSDKIYAQIRQYESQVMSIKTTLLERFINK